MVFQGYLKCNLNKKYYPIKHVIKSGMTANDYVVDPNFDLAASTTDYVTANFSNIAFRPTVLNKLLSLQENNKFYCLENTMKADFQQIGQTTLVVYQARYYVNSDDASAVVSNAKHLYKHLGKAYTSFAQLKDAGVDVTTLPTEKSYNSTDETNTNYSDAEIAQFAAKGITVYNGGVCYYVYKIKHVSSEVNNDVMEFAVVRNNVYKLKLNSVTGIGKGSHEDVKTPGTTEPTPENPDELDDTESNLNVQVVILPWTIRNNDIIL